MSDEQKKRAIILKTTLRLVAEHGLESAPMSLIAKEAGVGMGTIYHYFPSKDDLINVLYRELKQAVHENMLRNYDYNAPIRERFFTIWRNLFHHYLKHPLDFLFLEQYSISPTITLESKAFGFKLWAEPMQLFENAQHQQVVKEMPLYLLMLIASAPLNNLVRGHLSNQIKLDDGLIEVAITACWDAIKR